MSHPLRHSLPVLSLLLALSLPAAGPEPAAPPPQAGGADAGERPAEPEDVLAELSWLAGTWVGEAWGGRFEAFYSTPEGGRVLSHSRLFVDEQERYHEFEVFEPHGDDVRMQPYPRGRAATGFALTELDRAARRATFENPAKDFPTRIVYHRAAENQLVITLSDPHGGSGKVEVFDLAR